MIAASFDLYTKHLHRIQFMFVDFYTSVLFIQQGKLRTLSTSDMFTHMEDIINGLCEN